MIWQRFRSWMVSYGERRFLYVDVPVFLLLAGYFYASEIANLPDGDLLGPGVIFLLAVGYFFWMPMGWRVDSDEAATRMARQAAIKYLVYPIFMFAWYGYRVVYFGELSAIYFFVDTVVTAVLLFSGLIAVGWALYKQWIVRAFIYINIVFFLAFFSYLGT